MTKYALAIGINEYGGDNSLQGCVNDAKDWGAFLQERDFIVNYLLDNEATMKNMVDLIIDVLESAQRGDTFVLTYSGHGTWVPDVNGDESDGRDEALCPVDCIETGNVLTDDELYTIFSTYRKNGVKLVFFSDSCHSGTVSRFMPPLNFPTMGWGHKARFLPPANVLRTRDLTVARELETAQKKEKNSRQTCLLFSGCKDTEYSYDAMFNGRNNGAFTYAVLGSLASPNLITYRDLFGKIRTKLPSVDYPQTPQLTGYSTWKNWELDF